MTVEGLVASPVSWSLPELSQLPQTEIVTDIHCVTRWSKLDARFRGVLLKDLLDRLDVDNRAAFVSFVARSRRKHSSSLPLSNAMELGTLLATHYEGQPLPADHGGPLRGVVPGRYFYKSVKWIERIVLLAEDQPGYWEAESGYHNAADPWKEQRYIASSISRRDAAQLIERKDFSGLDLLSIDVNSLDLSGLIATRATMRNANFEKCVLRGANFRKANLSNASFRHADLSHADLRQADLEGADFAGADLRGADLTDASMFGTTFCDASPNAIENAARLDRRTKFNRNVIDVLTEPQQKFISRFLQATP